MPENITAKNLIDSLWQAIKSWKQYKEIFTHWFFKHEFIWAGAAVGFIVTSGIFGFVAGGLLGLFLENKIHAAYETTHEVVDKLQKVYNAPTNVAQFINNQAQHAATLPATIKQYCKTSSDNVLHFCQSFWPTKATPEPKPEPKPEPQISKVEQITREELEKRVEFFFQLKKAVKKKQAADNHDVHDYDDDMSDVTQCSYETARTSAPRR